MVNKNNYEIIVGIIPKWHGGRTGTDQSPEWMMTCKSMDSGGDNSETAVEVVPLSCLVCP
jgi:hypothetical protein